ncbi:MAG: RNA degradosome polyphosphate kinase, partial [Armatimonadetes bacterium]|nr:RNA degradosome polyphosphate kinase [Armatimonadota bacterium]
MGPVGRMGRMMPAGRRRDGGATPGHFNREISWLEFNQRVLQEATGDRHPLLERAKFLSIVHSNLDEFFMIRVSGLQEQVEAGLTEPSKDGRTPAEQLAAIRERVGAMRRDAWTCFRDELQPQLREAGIRLLPYNEVEETGRKGLRQYFDTVAYPVLTPLAVDPAHPFPHISNLSISLAVVVKRGVAEERFARVKIPKVLPRLVAVEPDAGSNARRRGRNEYTFVWLEDLIATHLPALFRGLEVVRSYPFRVIRDADFGIREDEAGDLLQSI